MRNWSGRPPTEAWHRPHFDKECRCGGLHLRLDEVLFDPDPAPANPMAWPTRPLEPGDRLAAVRLDEDGGAVGGHLCYRCYRRHAGRGAWRIVTADERDELPAGGCSTCARPWHRSAFNARAWTRSVSHDGGRPGLVCLDCAYTGPGGRWFQPTGLRLSAEGRAWFRLLAAGDPALETGLHCTGCGRQFGRIGAVEIIGERTPEEDRPRPRGGKARYPRMLADTGLRPPWPYLSHPWELSDATAWSAPEARPCRWSSSALCPVKPAHSDTMHGIVAAMAVHRGTRLFGPAFRNWFLAARRDQDRADFSTPVVWQVPGHASGPYACKRCALSGLVPHAVPVYFGQLLSAAVPPPAPGIACTSCVEPVIPERWHRYHRPHPNHDPGRCYRGDACHACAPCDGPHLGRDEVLRPPGYLAGFYGARPTRELRADDTIGGAVLDGDTEQLLCRPCYARGRRSARPHRPLYPADRRNLPAACDRCHRPWPLSTWQEPDAE